MRRAGVGALAGLLLCVAGPVHAERIVDYEVGIYAQDDGALFITETILYDFEGVRRHGIYRDIPLVLHAPPFGTRHLTLRLLEGRRDGSPMRGWRERLRNRRGEPFVRWHLSHPQKTLTGRHRYEFRYRVEGALFSVDREHDALIWNAIGTGWRVPMDEVHVVFDPPPRLRARPDLAVRLMAVRRGRLAPAVARHEIMDGAHLWHLRDLRPGDGLRVEAVVPHGVLPSGMPGREIAWMWREHKGEIAFYALCLACILGYGIYGWRHAREPALGRIVVRYAPPEGLEAGEAAILLQRGHVGREAVAAVIAELGREGFLKVVRKEDGGWFGRRKHFVFERTRDPADWESLPAYKRELLRALFPAGAETYDRERIRFVDVHQAERKAHFQRFREYLTSRGKALGLFVDDPGKPGCWPVVATWVLTFVLVVFAIALRPRWGFLMFFVPFVLIAIVLLRRKGGRLGWQGAVQLSLWLAVPLGGTVLVLSHAPWDPAALLNPAILVHPFVVAIFTIALMFVVASRIPRRTSKGVALLRELLGFRQFMARAERARIERMVAEDPTYFERTLPFALVFGLAATWAPLFAGLVPPPNWYEGGDGVEVGDVYLDLGEFDADVGDALGGDGGDGGDGGGDGGDGGGSD